MSIKGAMAAALVSIRQSTVQIGNAYEQRSMRLLNEHFLMDVKRVGGKGDGGIDLRGYWMLPGLKHLEKLERDPAGWGKLRIIGQCKAERPKVGPKTVREMEGVVSAMSVNEPLECPTIGVMTSQSGFSKAALDRAAASAVPLVMIDMPSALLPPEPDNAVRQYITEATEMTTSNTHSDLLEIRGAWWNQSVAKVFNHEIELRRVHQDVGEENSHRLIQRPMLWRNGKALRRYRNENA